MSDMVSYGIALVAIDSVGYKSALCSYFFIPILHSYIFLEILALCFPFSSWISALILSACSRVSSLSAALP